MRLLTTPLKWGILCISLGLMIQYGTVGVSALDEVGASLERVSYSPEVLLSWLVPPNAEIILVNDLDQVYASYRDNQNGKIIAALSVPDVIAANYAAFYSDGIGISSRVSMNFSQLVGDILMPPTIYSMPRINNQPKALGFVGSVYPLSNVTLTINSYTNEKQEYKTLANSQGEWQIIPPELSPGEYQAWVNAEFQGLKSIDSQLVQIQVLTAGDQIIKDLGSTSRTAFDRTVDVLPAPMQTAMKEIDKQSDMVSKVILPAILTVSAVTTSGILIQNALYVLLQMLLLIGQALGIVQKKQPIGVVYDAVTKKPLGRAIVRLYNSSNQRLVETDVTSVAGIFSFMPKEGYYYLRVSMPGYIFPSRLVVSKRDGGFSPVYSGEEIMVTSGEAVINVAVPLDPEAYQPTPSLWFKQIWQRWSGPVNYWLLWFGFFLAFLAYTRLPSRTNFLILSMYITGLFYLWYQGRRVKREYGLVVNEAGKPLPEVELNLVDTEYNRLVSRRVSDRRGRYQFVAPPGTYTIQMVTPAYRLLIKSRGAYQGEKLVVAGKRGQTKRLVPKIVVKKI